MVLNKIIMKTMNPKQAKVVFMSGTIFFVYICIIPPNILLFEP